MADPLVVAMLKTNLRYQSQRQGELARNVANIDTPGYKAHDLKKIDFKQMVDSASGPAATVQPVVISSTSAMHLSGTPTAGSFASEKTRRPFEVSPTANSVTVEEQMAKISDTATQYELSTSMLKKFSAMYKTALGTNH